MGREFESKQHFKLSKASCHSKHYLVRKRPGRSVLELGQPVAHPHVLLVRRGVDAEDGLDQFPGLFIRNNPVHLHLGQDLDDAVLLLRVVPEIGLPQVLRNILAFG